MGDCLSYLPSIQRYQCGQNQQGGGGQVYWRVSGWSVQGVRRKLESIQREDQQLL
jgi:hypothetical protein